MLYILLTSIYLCSIKLNFFNAPPSNLFELLCNCKTMRVFSVRELIVDVVVYVRGVAYFIICRRYRCDKQQESNYD